MAGRSQTGPSEDRVVYQPSAEDLVEALGDIYSVQGREGVSELVVLAVQGAGYCISVGKGVVTP